jgi:phosphatidylglycerophosphatase A
LTATGLGTGYSPVAPGTAGTLVGIPLFLILSKLAWPWYLATIIVLSIPAVYVCGEAEKIFQARDSQKIVLDEIMGLQFTLFLVSPTLPHIIAGFVLFRFFDITKVFPARFCEKLPGGLGVMADDIIAGIYANIILLLVIRFMNI